ncbi:hypothetical protein LCGC14_0808620 [marine sediment metagenome]|uniref:Uncharacterized protein n=1 Tax=marine sediment metagenome TaxID=412755 RepID=A0A0F9SUW7_9ZZZZ
MADELKNIPLTGLVFECLAKGLTYEGQDAEELRKKLSPKP